MVIRVHYEFRGVRTDTEVLSNPVALPLLAPVRQNLQVDEEKGDNLSLSRTNSSKLEEHKSTGKGGVPMDADFSDSVTLTRSAVQTLASVLRTRR